MTSFASILLRVFLVLALSLNGIAASAMALEATRLHGAAIASSDNPRSDHGPASDTSHSGHPAAASTASADASGESNCHDDGSASPQAQAPRAQQDWPPSHGGHDDCCKNKRCVCDCLQAAVIALFDPSLPARQVSPLIVPAAEASAPSGVHALPIRPPIA